MDYESQIRKRNPFEGLSLEERKYLFVYMLHISHPSFSADQIKRQWGSVLPESEYPPVFETLEIVEEIKKEIIKRSRGPTPQSSRTWSCSSARSVRKQRPIPNLWQRNGDRTSWVHQCEQILRAVKKNTILGVVTIMIVLGIGGTVIIRCQRVWRHEKIRTAAEQGHVLAQFKLGDCYHRGDGVVKDEAEAVKWWRKAADQGHARAQAKLGEMYETGLGVEKDESEAVEFYRKAADMGDAEAQRKLGWCYLNGNGVAKDESEAVAWFYEAAKKGDAKAHRYLGYCYFNGNGVAKDESEAVDWFYTAADKGDAVALSCLGKCRFLGRGTTKNEVEAVKLFRKAADKGVAEAQYLLGVGYEYGCSVLAKDESEAIKFYRNAARQGNVAAQKRLRQRNLKW